MSDTGIVRLAKAIGYPQEVPAGVQAFDFIVDGEVISAEARGGLSGEGAIVLKVVLTDDEGTAGRLATYAAGRLLKENAVLAWDPEKRVLVLWEEVTGSGEGEQRRRFESFCDSADWWRERASESSASNNSSDKFLIRP